MQLEDENIHTEFSQTSMLQQHYFPIYGIKIIKDYTDKQYRFRLDTVGGMMMQSENYGKVLHTSEEIRWVQTEPFCFDFIKESKGSTTLFPVDDYLEGITLDNRHISMYMTRAMQVHEGVAHFNTDIVIKGKQGENRKLIGLQFTGGVLGLLFRPDKLNIDMTKRGNYKVTCKEDRIEQEVLIGEKKYTISVESSLYEHCGVAGKSLVNDQVILEVVAADGIGRKDIVPIYNAVYKMCQFLTFRKNVQFSKVELLVEECWDGEVFPITGGTVFSRDHFEKATEKNWNRCISFETMKECMGTLFKMIYVEKVNKPYFSLNFLPENDADENWISVEKIRNICTALECEAMLQKLSAEDNPDFKDLMESVKNMVKAHKESTNALPPKAYDLINSSISHWDFAAADKVKALFHKYYEIIFQLECFKMSQAKFEEGVDRIIRLRNRTTHGNFASVSSEDAMVAVNLMNIIYISRLDRLGLSKDVIRHLIVRGVVY